MTGYTAASITALSPLDAVRKRPGMYIGGSTNTEGLKHLLWEALDNAVDEAAEGHGDLIEVVLHADGSYEVTDRGRGIPVGEHPSGRSALEVVFTELHAGGKFDGESYTSSGGLHGVGAAVINALSERVQVTVKRRRKTWRMDFSRRVPGYFHPDTGFSPDRDPTVVGSGTSQTGTSVRFWPDSELFRNGTRIGFRAVRDRLKQTSWLTPGVTLRAECKKTGRRYETVSRDGLADCLEELRADAEPLSGAVTFTSEGHYDENVPDKTGEVTTTRRTCRVSVAFRWLQSPHPGRVRTFVNTVPTADGGTHLSGFERALLTETRKEIARRDPPKLRKLASPNPVKDDCLHGMIAAVRVQVPEPQFTSQTKTKLGTRAVGSVVNQTARECFSSYFAGDLRGSYKSHIDAIIKKIVGRIVARNEQEAETAASKSIAKLRTSPKLAKLSDCRQHPSGELLIVEGDSAAGPAKRARDSYWQAVLPIRGKIINAAKNTTTQLLANAEAQALISAVGAGTGGSFDLSKARYQRIVLLADADVDGAHIRCLLLTLIWQTMRPLLTDGRVFSAQPPTHSVATRDGNKQFCYSQTELEDTLRRSRPARPRVTRFKGLGEMNDEELLATCLDPNTRLLRQVSLHDAAAATEAVRALMGADVSLRREFVMADRPELAEAA